MRGPAPANVIHLAPPHSVEGEQGVLGSMLLSPRDGIAEAVEKLEENYFYVPAHRTIFSVLVDLWKKDAAIDLITFTQELRDRNLLESVGGPAFVTSLWTFVPTAANIAFYLAIVREKHVLREIIASGTEAVRRAYEEQDDPTGLLEDYQTRAIEIGHLAADESTSKPLGAFIDEALKAIEFSFYNRGHATGISTGFNDLDRTMNGFEQPLTYYFAARPAMGKSALMVKFAYNIGIAAAAQKQKIKIFSIEMTGHQLAKRLICMLANIRLKSLRPVTGFMEGTAHDPVALNRARDVATELMTDYISIDEKGDLSINEFRSRARQAVVKEKCKLIMIDYLQRMKCSDKNLRNNREQQVNEIAQGISATAKELKVPIIVLAQLNRNPEDRPDGKPELGDLRESGSIEQEARFVGLLWRPWYYARNSHKKREKLMKELDLDEEQLKQYVECIVAKQNEGPSGAVPLRFIEDYARFEAQDPERPLFSNRPEQRQQKEGEAAEIAMASIKEIFPNAEVSSNGDGHHEPGS